MKHKLLIILTLTLISLSSFAQSISLKGSVEDKASNVKLKNATVSVLNAKDSTLYKFTRANQDGSFLLENIKRGDFVLLVTYPEYADYVNHFKADDSKEMVDFGNIDLKNKAKLLNEVLIKGQATAIKIKGDTTEFNAAAYNIKPNDRVEDLIKQFPGIQVDANGQITAQGKKVEKVLVDGEEFFGDDPTLVTKNLRADMVDKVQLFEKSSDQAAFTGVDDGQKHQTLNIKLKDDKKNGYFGKVDAGFGTDNVYEGQAMFNKFKNKEKIAAFGTASKTGKTGLNWQDASKYGQAGGFQEVDNGIMFTNSSDELDNSNFWGEGIPKTFNGALHYENKWDKDKQSINTNYKVGSLNISKKKNTISQYNLVDGINISKNDEDAESDIFRQKVDFTYKIDLDTTSNLKVALDGTLKNTDNDNHTQSETRNELNALVNASDRSTSAEGKQQLFNFNVLFNKKLKKKGRNYSINLSNNYNKSNNDTYQNFLNKYYTNNIETVEHINQLKDNDFNNNSFSTNITYNEPFTKELTLTTNYGFGYSANKSHVRTYDASAPNQYDLLNQEYTTNFDADQITNQFGSILSYKKGKINLSGGLKVALSNFNQTEKYSNTEFNRDYSNWLPQARFQYKFSQQKSFTFNYRGNNKQPSVNQLQPLKTNDDPFNQYIGNPSLRPEFSNRVSLDYNSYKVIADESLYLSASYSFTDNAIVNNVKTDDQGRNEYSAENLANHSPFNFDIWADYSKKIKFLANVNVGIGVNANGNTYYNYVTSGTPAKTALNKTSTISFNPSLNLRRNNEKLDFYITLGPNYTQQQASVQKMNNTKGWGYGSYLYSGYKFPKKISLSVDGNYQYRPNTGYFDESLERLILNASLAKSFFKNEEFKLRLTAKDILNQNKGFNRSAYGNTIYQTSYNNIGQYFMLSAIWEFNKMGGVAKSK